VPSGGNARDSWEDNDADNKECHKIRNCPSLVGDEREKGFRTGRKIAAFATDSKEPLAVGRTSLSPGRGKKGTKRQNDGGKKCRKGTIIHEVGLVCTKKAGGGSMIGEFQIKKKKPSHVHEGGRRMSKERERKEKDRKNIMEGKKKYA